MRIGETKTLLVILAFLLFPSATLAQQLPDWRELEKVAAEEIQAANAPGAVVAIVSRDRVIFAKGFGVANVETGVPVTANTLFQIGSLSKTFTAAGLVGLAEEGKLKLVEPIGKYVKGLSPKLSNITAHQLLSHTAGIKDQPDDYGLHDDAAVIDFVRSWKEDDYLLLPSGKVFSYDRQKFEREDKSFSEANALCGN